MEVTVGASLPVEADMRSVIAVGLVFGLTLAGWGATLVAQVTPAAQQGSISGEALEPEDGRSPTFRRSSFRPRAGNP